MNVRDRALVWGYGAAWSLIGAMPERAAYWLFDRVADRLWKRRGARVRQLEANLLRVLGKDTPPEALAAMSRRGMRSAMRYYCEAFRLNRWDRSRIVDSVDIADEDRARLAAAIGSERGAVMALGHTGNYDHAGAWLVAAFSIEFTTVAENLKPAAVAERFWDYRRRLGMEVLPHDGGASVVGTLARRLRAGRTVCLVADRDLSASGVPVDFFGETTRIAAGPAALAVLTGCALHPVNLWFTAPGRMGIRVHPEIPVPAEGTRREKIAAMTQALADAYAEGIAAHPEDWHMMQKYFLADLAPPH
ncbi:phosphatidylinositol mannoside acyltransferase [Paractinoplanes lichenicola]|uniref:Phosphatidylinositol mannoside acyltransferase n=1 Tax=Paractinoplanes lichenicola TaxID=2802976 RepID=A0ABS1VDF5_9ACTN|nr:phosphatidylinositol mannoside acyltransferase [Actinoplanes lichenicola]MBL7252696.1 phosphatidylinositol mannoside acyltransferase [Actinoplanes lichenicola]